MHETANAQNFLRPHEQLQLHALYRHFILIFANINPISLPIKEKLRFMKHIYRKVSYTLKVERRRKS